MPYGKLCQLPFLPILRVRVRDLILGVKASHRQSQLYILASLPPTAHYLSFSHMQQQSNQQHSTCPPHHQQTLYLSSSSHIQRAKHLASTCQTKKTSGRETKTPNPRPGEPHSRDKPQDPNTPGLCFRQQTRSLHRYCTIRQRPRKPTHTTPGQRPRKYIKPSNRKTPSPHKMNRQTQPPPTIPPQMQISPGFRRRVLCPRGLGQVQGVLQEPESVLPEQAARPRHAMSRVRASTAALLALQPMFRRMLSLRRLA